MISCDPAGRELYMQHYRAYIIGEDGHIVSAVDLQCEQEDVATALAGQLVNGRCVELWQGGGQIALFESRPE
jgi:hypothetical protein